MKPYIGITGFMPQYDKRAEGWKLVKSAKLGKDRLIFKEFLEENESHIKGYELIKRAERMGNPAGQLHAENILKQTSLIPNEVEKFTLIFTGTIWAHPDGYQCVPALRIGKCCDIEALAGFGMPVYEGLHNYGWIIDFVRLDKGLLTPARVAIIEK